MGPDPMLPQMAVRDDHSRVFGLLEVGVDFHSWFVPL